MKNALQIQPNAGDDGYTVRTADGTHAGDLARDVYGSPSTWLFYCVGSARPIRFHAADAATAFAFLENLSRAFRS